MESFFRGNLWEFKTNDRLHRLVFSYFSLGERYYLTIPEYLRPLTKQHSNLSLVLDELIKRYKEPTRLRRIIMTALRGYIFHDSDYFQCSIPEKQRYSVIIWREHLDSSWIYNNPLQYGEYLFEPGQNRHPPICDIVDESRIFHFHSPIYEKKIHDALRKGREDYVPETPEPPDEISLLKPLEI